MKQMQGKQSILFQNPVKILSHACVGGKKECEGPIGKKEEERCENGFLW